MRKAANPLTPEARIDQFDIKRRKILGLSVVGALAAPFLIKVTRARSNNAGSKRSSGAETFTPEMFGAKGDGKTNDTAAMQRMAQHVAGKSPVTIAFTPESTYMLGHQARSLEQRGGFRSEPLLNFADTRGLHIRGNGATLRLADGLRYGSFDPGTGEAFQPHSGGFTDRAYRAAVGSLITVSGEDIAIENLVLDGNADGLILGGYWGDKGYQIEARGLTLRNCRNVRIKNVSSHNHAQDGFYIDAHEGEGAYAAAPNAINFENCVAERNGRQGLSIVNGSGMLFQACRFADTGQGSIYSAPGGGVDIEPHHDAADLRFERCLFENNRGVGLVCDSGISKRITASDCIFWAGFEPEEPGAGGSGDALWVAKPEVRIEDCRIYGNLTHALGDTQFERCAFSNAVHPRYGRAAAHRRYLVDSAAANYAQCHFETLPGSHNRLVYGDGEFERCTFIHDGKEQLAAVFQQAVIDNCRFELGAKASPASYIKFSARATLRGRNLLSGIRRNSAKGVTNLTI